MIAEIIESAVWGSMLTEEVIFQGKVLKAIVEIGAAREVDMICLFGDILRLLLVRIIEQEHRSTAERGVTDKLDPFGCRCLEKPRVYRRADRYTIAKAACEIKRFDIAPFRARAFKQGFDSCADSRFRKLKCAYIVLSKRYFTAVCG